MGINQDFRDLLKIFNEFNVEYLIIGGYAVIFYTMPRFTKDIDIWINPTATNAKAVWSALHEFGAPLLDVTESDFCNPELVYQIGIAPNRIDIIMGAPGLSFESAWMNRTIGTYGDVPIAIIGKQDLIHSKQMCGRLQDAIDVENLTEKK